MKVLIAVSSKEFSAPTLSAGMKISQSFKAMATIVDVGEKINDFSLKEVGMAQERMESWDFDRPGVDVLEWAFDYLAKNKLIKTTSIDAGFPKNTLVEKGSSRAEVFLEGSVSDNVNLILRNGDIIEELRDEVQSEGYDVTVIGASKKRGMAYDLVQYIESSIFVANNYNSNQSYRILLAVNDSPAMKKTVKYGVRVAQAFGIGVDIITISTKEEFGKDYKEAASWAAKLLRRSGIEYKSRFEVGDPSDLIATNAGEDHIVVMGASSRNPLKTFFKSNKPLKVLENCKCPILIVK